MSWYYNTESGALTSAGAVQGFFQDFQAALGLSAGWHKLNIPDTATEAQAAAEARKEFPAGKAPTTSVPAQLANTAGGIPGASAFSSAANALTGFYDVVTNGKMWRSLGWLLLGIVLMFIGIAMFIGPSASRMSPLGAARKAVL
jgi:predicted phage tail protein